jgi:hypothetical protein
MGFVFLRRLAVCVCVVLVCLSEGWYGSGVHVCAKKYGKKKNKKRELTEEQEVRLKCDMCVRAVDQFIQGVADTENNWKVQKRHRIDEKKYIRRSRSDERLAEIMDDVKRWFTQYSLRSDDFGVLQATDPAVRGVYGDHRVVKAWDKLTRRIVSQMTDKVLDQNELDWVAVFHNGEDGDPFHQRVCVDKIGVCADAATLQATVALVAANDAADAVNATTTTTFGADNASGDAASTPQLITGEGEKEEEEDGGSWF